jgi:hypothetical protein
MSKNRKIKCLGNSIDTNEIYLHPITLELVVNKGPKKICPTELHYVNNKPYTGAPIENPNLTEKDIQSFMALPYLNLNIEHMLSIYKIESIDSMVKWIDECINLNKQFNYINRILNIWIRFNFEELTKNNKILVSIYKKLNNKYYNISLNNIEEKINEWFSKTKYDDFNVNLAKYLYK